MKIETMKVTLIVFIAALVLSGCASFTIGKIAIQKGYQGNVLVGETKTATGINFEGKKISYVTEGR